MDVEGTTGMVFGKEVPLDYFLSTFLLSVTAFLFLYWYSTRNHDYWKKRGVPYLKPSFFLGTVTDYMRTPLNELEIKRYTQLGAVYGYFEGNRPVLTIGDPEILRKVLLKDFQFFSARRDFPTNDDVLDSMLHATNGEKWKRIRTIVTPTFTSGKLKRMLSIFKDCSKTLMNNLKTLAEKGDYLDAKRVYGAFTMDVIASSAFSVKIDSHNDPDNEFTTSAKAAFEHRMNWRMFLHILLPGMMKFLGLSVKGGELNFFKDIALQIIEERNKTGQTRNDFLQLLMDTAKGKTTEESGKRAPQEGKEDITSNYDVDDATRRPSNIPNFNKELSRNEMVAQCVIFFIAGYETTSAAMSFISYCLALNQDVQDKLREEVDNVLKEGGLTYEAIQSMKYMDNVISEALRLYPPLVRVERIADADYEMSELGITIPKGMVVTVPIYAMQRNPKYFPNPEQFDPNRFSAEEKAKRHQYAYIPFVAGPRNCIAIRFALLQLKVCLAYVISSFKIKRCPRTKVPLKFNIEKALLKPKEIIVALEQRRDGIQVK